MVEKAGTAKATFYKYFPSRTELEVATLDAEHQAAVDELAQLESAHDSAALALGAFVDVSAERLATMLAGDLFIQAAVAYSDPEHPTREAARSHLAWTHRQLTRLFGAAGHPTPADAADELTIALSGAELVAHTRDRTAAAGGLRRTLAKLLDEAKA